MSASPKLWMVSASSAMLPVYQTIPSWKIAVMNRPANDHLTARNIPVLLDTTDLFLYPATVIGISGGSPYSVLPIKMAGYVSWGSNDAHFSSAVFGRLRFAPGAIAETAVSTSASTGGAISPTSTPWMSAEE